MLIIITFHLLIHLAYTDTIWYNNMNAGSGWTISGKAWGSKSSTYCDKPDCVYIDNGVSIQKDGLSTSNYKNIQLRYSIYPLGLKGSGRCRVSYSVDQNTWTMLEEYDYRDKNNKYIAETYNMGNDAEDQSSISIKFESIATGTNDNCYIDEIYILGTPNNPTKQPTVHPTMSPTSYPTKYPTSDPTEHHILLDPTKSPTSYPTKYPTSYPTISPTLDPTENPTNDPVIDPTMDPTSDPTKAPTSDPTKAPTSDPTTNPTPSPSILPTVYPTTYNVRQTIEVGSKTTDNKAVEYEHDVHEITTTEINFADKDIKDESQPSILSDEYLLNNWYYLAIVGGIFICLLCMIIICCSRKRKNIKEMHIERKHVERVMSMSMTNALDIANEIDNKIGMENAMQIQSPHSISPSAPSIMSTPMGLKEYENGNNNGNDNDGMSMISVVITPGVDINALDGGETGNVDMYDVAATNKEIKEDVGRNMLPQDEDDGNDEGSAEELYAFDGNIHHNMHTDIGNEATTPQ